MHILEKLTGYAKERVMLHLRTFIFREKPSGGYRARIPGKRDSAQQIPFAFQSFSPFDLGRALEADNTHWTSQPPDHCLPALTN